MKKHQLPLGLLPKTQDERDFQLGAFFMLPKDLPKSFSLKPPKVKNQGNSDLCSQFALSSMAEMMDKEELSPLWAFSVAKLITGNPESWGLQMRDAFKVWVKYGGVPEKDSEYKVGQAGNPKIRFYENWLETYPMRFNYGKGSFWNVGNSFEDIKQAIYKFKEPVAIGVLWGWKSKEEKLELKDWKTGGGGHMMFAYGWKGDYLQIQNSWGTGVGKKGRHLIHKDAINKFTPIFGAMTWTDLSVDKAKYFLENEIKENENWLIQLLKILLSNIKSVTSKK